MKKLGFFVTLAILLIFASSTTAAPIVTQLDVVDIGSPSCHPMSGWGPVEPATHGGSYGGISNTQCIWEPGSGESGRSAMITLDTGGAGKARRILLEHLDGIADDSFNTYVKNP